MVDKKARFLMEKRELLENYYHP